MFDESSKYLLRQFYNTIKINKFLIIFLSLCITVISYIYKEFSPQYELKRNFVFPIESYSPLIDSRVIYNTLNEVFTTNNQKGEIHFKGYRSRSEYIVQMIAKGNNEEKLEKDLTNFVNTYLPKVEQAHSDKFRVLNNAKLEIHKSIKEKESLIKQLDSINNQYIELASKKNIINNLEQLNDLEDVRANIKKVLRDKIKNMPYKDYMHHKVFKKSEDIDINDFFVAKDTVVSQNMPNKKKFLIFSLLFSIIGSMALVLIFKGK